MKRLIFHYVYNDKVDLTHIYDWTFQSIYDAGHFKVSVKELVILNSAGRSKDTGCICKNYLITAYIKAEVEK